MSGPKVVTVWIVEGDDFEDQAVRSIWTTEQAAIADFNRRLIASPDERLQINEYEVDPKDNQS